MEVRSGFLGSLDLTSLKLKQTVNLNRRTVFGLDCKLTRFERERAKNTNSISREKEKFLEKQSRILPHIKPEKNALRPESSRSSMSCSSRNSSGSITKDLKRENALLANISSEKTDAVASKVPEILPLRHSVMTKELTKKYSRPELLALKLEDDKLSRTRSTTYPFLNRTGSQGQMRRAETFNETSNCTRKSPSSPKAPISPTLMNNFPTTEKDKCNWNKLRNNLDSVISVDENESSEKEEKNCDDTSKVYEQLRDCRYIRRTKEQRFELENVPCKTCYCNSCTLHKSSPQCTKKFHKTEIRTLRQ